MSYRRALAEAFGTFVLVFGGVGTAVIAGDKIGNLGVAFAFGLSLLAMAYAIGPVSGCHINPAVTFGLLAARQDRRCARRALLGRAGRRARSSPPACCWSIVKGRAGGYDAGTDGLRRQRLRRALAGRLSARGAAFVVEVMLTALLVFTVLAATDRIANVAFAGIPIGLVLTLIHLVGIPVDNLSVNPARSIGPAVFVGGWALASCGCSSWLRSPAAVVGAAVHLALHGGVERIDPEESAVAAEGSA